MNNLEIRQREERCWRCSSSSPGDPGLWRLNAVGGVNTHVPRPPQDHRGSGEWMLRFLSWSCPSQSVTHVPLSAVIPVKQLYKPVSPLFWEAALWLRLGGRDWKLLSAAGKIWIYFSVQFVSGLNESRGREGAEFTAPSSVQLQMMVALTM